MKKQSEILDFREIAREYCPNEPPPYHDGSTAHGMHFNDIIAQVSSLQDYMYLLEQLEENERNEMIKETHPRLVLKTHMIYRWLSEAITEYRIMIFMLESPNSREIIFDSDRPILSIFKNTWNIEGEEGKKGEEQYEKEEEEE